MADPQSPKNHRPLLVLIKIILAIIVAVTSLSLCGNSEETSSLHPLFEFGFDQSAEIFVDGIVEILFK
jgi:hypothetical protein